MAKNTNLTQAQIKKDWKDIKTEIKIYINTAKREVSDLEE